MIHLATSVWGSDNWVSCLYHMALSWRNVIGSSGSKIYVGCPRPMTYCGSDMSDIGVVQIVNESFLEKGSESKWLFHPVDMTHKNDTIVIVEADVAFFRPPKKEELVTDAIERWDNIDSYGACAYACLKASSHTKLICAAKGITMSSMCDSYRMKDFVGERSIQRSLERTTKGYSEVYKKPRRVLDAQHRFMTLDEIVYAEAVNLAIESFCFRPRHMKQGWYGSTNCHWPDEKDGMIVDARMRRMNHLDLSRELFPEAGLVHLPGSELLYSGDGRGRFVR